MNGEFEIEIGDGKKINVEWEFASEDNSHDYVYGSVHGVRRRIEWDVEFNFHKENLTPEEISDVECELKRVDVLAMIASD